METTKEIGMIVVTIATILMPDIDISKYLGLSEIVDTLCNSSIGVIGVLVAVQLLRKYKKANKAKEISNEREAWELSEDKRKAKEN